mmetsp:Transcript_37368/g.76668  ORF Transcript_37368/g.76668 Transcript_37368/m.76668 type:complete len:306 (-) Transcript_37368:178-1095(-)|eukprot:CAMPEP_0181293258 /NCGR_PEP_ID=MMETSP1101-20121128/2970_1 /TAXON_ID=46948 /ORGANISM="Rhodomonas abbreviata, Strain Caron Lab Isolate" /LENGTH=305 /DNA_ID=CAMNT_0023397835 /DNA_START=292 /DNA_END=1209 /DNA_ORIENTATION=+
MPSYRKKQHQDPCVTPPPARRGTVSQYADSVLEQSDSQGEPEENLPTVHKRPFESAFDKLRWTDDCLANKKTPKKKAKVKSKKQQLFLDFGQKDFNSKMCECGMVYCPGQEEDEKMHKSNHDVFLNGIRFPGWTKERIVGKFADGSRIVCIRSQDHATHLNKAKEVQRLVRRELGATELPDRDKTSRVYYLLVSQKGRVVGFVLAETIRGAFRIVVNTNNGQRSDGEVMCISTEESEARLGISEIWVQNQYRRHGFGKRLLQCVVATFFEAGPVELSQCAFSTPTEAGRRLATNFFGTPAFLIYR